MSKTGLAVLIALRVNNENPPQCILMSGYGRLTERTALRFGFAGFVAKPFERDELDELVLGHLIGVVAGVA